MGNSSLELRRIIAAIFALIKPGGLAEYVQERKTAKAPHNKVTKWCQTIASCGKGTAYVALPNLLRATDRRPLVARQVRLPLISIPFH